MPEASRVRLKRQQSLPYFQLTVSGRGRDARLHSKHVPQRTRGGQLELSPEITLESMCNSDSNQEENLVVDMKNQVRIFRIPQ
jgi:hypothetical protein